MVPVIEERLRKIEELETHVHAFAWLDVQQAREAAAEAPQGPLSGLLVGVKDIIDTAGVPTEHGSRLFAGRVPSRSATVVQRIEAAGGIVAGKTVTAEMAYFTPGPTRNPWDYSRTPGGSSMGSAAAVAAGMLDLAVGTQTNGSIIRPAAFCGTTGYKPSFGIVPRDGVMTFSESLDTVGGFGTTVADAARLVGVMANRSLNPRPVARPRLAVAVTPEWSETEPGVTELFEAWMAELESRGALIERPKLPPGLAESVAVHRVIMAEEAYRSLGQQVSHNPDVVSARLRSLLDEGASIAPEWYREAIAERDRLVDDFTRWAIPYDALLTLPALGEAPGAETTGDPRLCTRWTLVGAPAVCIPGGRGPNGLPLGLQIIGAPQTDELVLGVAAWAEAALQQG